MIYINKSYSSLFLNPTANNNMTALKKSFGANILKVAFYFKTIYKPFKHNIVYLIYVIYDFGSSRRETRISETHRPLIHKSPKRFGSFSPSLHVHVLIKRKMKVEYCNCKQLLSQIIRAKLHDRI